MSGVSYRAIAETSLLLIVVAAPAAFGAVEPWPRALVQILSFALVAASLGADAPLALGAGSRAVVAAFGTVGLIGLLQGANPATTLGPAPLGFFTLSRVDTLEAVLSWLSLASLAWIAAQALRTPASLGRLAWCLTLTGAVLALVGLAQKAQGNTAYYGLRLVRHGSPFGPFVNYNHAANYLCMALPAAFGLLLADRRSDGSEPASELWARRGILGLCATLIFVGLCATRSRGGLVACTSTLVITGLVLAPTALPRRAAAALVPLTIGGLATGGVYLALHPEVLLAGPRADAVTIRMLLVQDGLRLVGDFPLFGTGLGALQRAFYPYQDRSIRGLVDHLHSDWIELASEVGLPLALAAALGLAWLCVSTTRRLLRDGPPRGQAFLRFGFITGVIAFAIQATVDFSFRIPANAALFTLLLAAMSAPTEDEPGWTPTLRIPRLLKGAVAAGCMLGSVWAVRPALAADQAYYGARADLASAPFYWTSARRFYPKPEYAYRLADSFMALADRYPAAKNVHLQMALDASRAACEADPLNPAYQALKGAILWRLGRIADAKQLLAT